MGSRLVLSVWYLAHLVLFPRGWRARPPGDPLSLPLKRSSHKDVTGMLATRNTLELVR